jgi:hypothetical protein
VSDELGWTDLDREITNEIRRSNHGLFSSSANFTPYDTAINHQKNCIDGLLAYVMVSSVYYAHVAEQLLIVRSARARMDKNTCFASIWDEFTANSALQMRWKSSTNELQKADLLLVLILAFINLTNFTDQEKSGNLTTSNNRVFFGCFSHFDVIFWSVKTQTCRKRNFECY